MRDLKSYSGGWARQFTWGEERAGHQAQTYQRVPFILYTNNLAVNASSGAGNAVPTQPEDLRNDTPYVMEVDAVGYSLQNAFAGLADGSLSQIAVMLKDVNREMPFFQKSYATASGISIAGNEMFARPCMLTELSASYFQGMSGAGDVLQWSGTKWNLRYPHLLPPGGTIACQAFSYVARDQLISIALIGSLLVPNLRGPIGDAAIPLGLPWQIPPPYKGDVIGFELVPYVLYSEASGAAAGTDCPELDLRNMSPYDMLIYEVGLYSSLLSATSASSAALPSISILDASRNVTWGKDFVDIQRLFEGMTNRNAISGQNPQWYQTKWDLGPGTILPSGEKLRARIQGASSGVTGLAFIGAVQRPVREGTVYAEAWRKHLSAVPAMAW